MHIGIDVGGTNTDAVLMDTDRVLATVKRPTTSDVTDGVLNSLADLATEYAFHPDQIQAVAIGTTHFTNAVVQARGLASTAVIRLGLPATTGILPLTAWPKRLIDAVAGSIHLCAGGHEFDGREIAPLDTAHLRRIAEIIAAEGSSSVAITSIFSPVNQEMEIEAAAVLQQELPEVNFSLSHEIGRIGLLERENATVINACLLPVAARITDAFEEALARSGIQAPLFLSQNDGTLMDVDWVRRYPVATFAAGPTNSMRGAAMLSGLSDCIVIDVGGTTSDAGALAGGFPRPATTAVDIAGVRTNFRMPDVISVGIGGGSLVTADAGSIEVGPESVGFHIGHQALVFGGSVLTATDIAVASGMSRLGDPSLVAQLDPQLVAGARRHIVTRLSDAANSMRTSVTPVPLVLVGGGSILVPDRLEGFDTVVRPEHSSVANAIGAAIAQVGGEVDKVFSGAGRTRQALLEQAKHEAIEKAIIAGAAADTIRVVEVDELPIAYLPGNSIRIRVKAIGDLAFARPSLATEAAPV